MPKLKLSVIIPQSQEGALTAEWAKKELAGIEHEILMAPNWATGHQKARGEYICFLERDCVLTPQYFSRLMNIFEDKPSFRKLAMVAPAIGIDSYDYEQFGYRFLSKEAYPSFFPSSTAPYLVQAAYVPGAIIRVSALDKMVIRERYSVTDSLRLSLYLWANGQRVVLDPNTFYITTDEELGESVEYNHKAEAAEETKATLEMFKREAIG